MCENQYNLNYCSVTTTTVCVLCLGNKLTKHNNPERIATKIWNYKLYLYKIPKIYPYNPC